MKRTNGKTEEQKKIREESYEEEEKNEEEESKSAEESREERTKDTRMRIKGRTRIREGEKDI